MILIAESGCAVVKSQSHLGNVGLMSSASTMRSEPFMISDLDIYRGASILIREHGEDAELKAAMRADAMLARGDLEGLAVWKRILRAVEEIRRTDLAEGEATH